MRILELQEYAKDNGFNSLKFSFKDLLSGQEKLGQWMEAYLGIFKIEGIGENTFITVKQWRDNIPDELIEFKLVL